MTTEALEQAIDSLCPPDPYTQGHLGDLLARFDRSPGARPRHELKHVVLTCPDPSVLGTETRQLFNNLALTIRSGVVRMELRERVEQWGSARAREAIARGTRQRGLQLTSMAWDAIEAAELDELAFLLGATYVDTTVGEAAKRFVPCSRTTRYASYYADSVAAHDLLSPSTPPDWPKVAALAR